MPASTFHPVPEWHRYESQKSKMVVADAVLAFFEVVASSQICPL
jgi:hypothetical protein